MLSILELVVYGCLVLWTLYKLAHMAAMSFIRENLLYKKLELERQITALATKANETTDKTLEGNLRWRLYNLRGEYQKIMNQLEDL